MTSAIFLQKTFDLIQVSPAEVAQWTEDGRSFVLKDLKTLESVWLDRYFRHNNFTSFARQLRSYGFSKTKKHDGCAGTVWEFHHPDFLRDAPERMALIRRNTAAHGDAKDDHGHDFDALKQQVARLERQVASLAHDLTSLATLLKPPSPKTYDMLQACPPSLAAWTDGGLGFVVFDTKGLEATMLARFFRHGNFPSFVRQLRFYGFSKCRRHENVDREPVWVFAHADFQRDDPKRMKKIVRSSNPLAKSEVDVDELRTRLDVFETRVVALSAQVGLLLEILHARAAVGSVTTLEPTEDDLLDLIVAASPSAI
ncbi:HSF-type DNA-binding [Achlya hypogyna]|uniref:HSF-type DNA-binding n=1 Tax=Achlya hypogyna TaxID=1202772 RepID=A0A1V9Y5C7_ACHHY|nr:HSF-type DNA-binding [Achlya hypogyna]